MNTQGKTKLAVLISGRGSNMISIINAAMEPEYPATVAVVISDNADAKGLVAAKDAGISTHALPRKDYASKQDHEAAIVNLIQEADIGLICLAGYMRLLSADFTKVFANRIINIHPSLLPKYKGLDTHQRAIDAGDTEHGCTVHYVNAEMDGGDIIDQRSVPILNDDTAETLSVRVLLEEHKLYPDVIKQLCIREC